jgi:predicted dehydrogenase
MPTTLALVGGAHIHTPGFINAIKKRGDAIRVKSVWDHDLERAKKRAAALNATVVEDFNEIYKDAEVSAVIICSETDLHEKLIGPAAMAKKHIFAEKPLGLGAKDSAAMADAIEKAGVMFQTGYFMRGQPAHQFIKQAIEAKHFGKITRARGSNCHGGAINGWFDTEWRWMADPKRSGVGGFGDLGTHMLDLLMWWLGDVATCTATLDKGTARYGDCDELGEGLIRFNSGVIATLAASWDDIANPVSVQIAGTEGHAAIVNGKVHFESKHVQGSDIKKPLEKLPDAVPAGFEAFLDAVTGKKVDLVPVREAAARVAVMEAMYQAAQQQKSMKPQ